MQINYDQVLKEEELEILIAEKTYTVLPPTMEQMLDYDRLIAETGKAKGAEKAAGVFRKAILSVYSSVPEEVLATLPLLVLRRMSQDITLYITGGKSAVESVKKK